MYTNIQVAQLEQAFLLRKMSTTRGELLTYKTKLSRAEAREFIPDLKVQAFLDIADPQSWYYSLNASFFTC